mgnify:CR=1 FL=1
MTYQEIERYISEIPKFTKKHSLSHTKRFLEILQIPQEKMKILHVAGTNGKGSVCVYLDAMLRSEGKRTGLFISPHLVKMNERIMIDGIPVSDEVFSGVFTQTLGAVKQMEAEGLEHPTFFEFLFGMGMLAFSQAEAEYVILETGLGGRLDATSATEDPKVCVITSIGLDHMEYLGNTVEQIAAVMQETRSNFEQFLGWSEDGEMVAYEKLCRMVEGIYGVGAMVERANGQGPVFGGEF